MACTRGSRGCDLGRSQVRPRISNAPSAAYLCFHASVWPPRCPLQHDDREMRRREAARSHRQLVAGYRARQTPLQWSEPSQSCRSPVKIGIARRTAAHGCVIQFSVGFGENSPPAGHGRSEPFASRSRPVRRLQPRSFDTAARTRPRPPVHRSNAVPALERPATFHGPMPSWTSRKSGRRTLPRACDP